MMQRLLITLLVLGVSPAMADDAQEVSATGKVVQYEADGGGMLANADVDWDRYSGILLEKASVEFRNDWERDQERLNNNIVRDADQAKIKSDMSDMLHGILVRKIADTEHYELTNTRGANVLRFTPRIAKLDIHAPGRVQGIIGNVLVDSKGSLVLVMEISDSVSGELLASAWRLEVDPDKGFMETATEAGNKTAFSRMMADWSSWLFGMLDHVRR